MIYTDIESGKMRGKSGASAATSGTGARWASTRRWFSWNPARAITPGHG